MVWLPKRCLQTPVYLGYRQSQVAAGIDSATAVMVDASGNVVVTGTSADIRFNSDILNYDFYTVEHLDPAPIASPTFYRIAAP